MLTPSSEIIQLLSTFARALTVPTFANALVLIYGTILAPGRRTVLRGGSGGNAASLTRRVGRGDEVGVKMSLPEVVDRDRVTLRPVAEHSELNVVEANGFQRASGFLVEQETLKSLLPGDGRNEG